MRGAGGGDAKLNSRCKREQKKGLMGAGDKTDYTVKNKDCIYLQKVEKTS